MSLLVKRFTRLRLLLGLGAAALIAEAVDERNH